MTPDDNDRLWEMAQELARNTEAVRELRRSVEKMPCIAHGEQLAALQVKAGVWGALGGILSAIVAIFGFGGFGK